MEIDFWHRRWQNKETGWHRDDVHPLLDSIADKFFPEHSEIFVPLCGKSLDMSWLAEKGHNIIGSELSELAIKEFFIEQHLQPEITVVDSFNVFQAGSYTIYQGDFFDLKPEYFSACDYWYDRAALIALPENMRVDYVNKIYQLFAKDTRGLLISLCFLSETRQGPPFSLFPKEIEKLWKDAYSVKHLSSCSSELSKGKGAGQLAKFKPSNVEEHAFEVIL